MKIDIHISDCSPQEMQKLAMFFNDGRRFNIRRIDNNAGTVADIMAVNNTPRGKTKSRPVVGQKGTQVVEWPSVNACAEGLEKAQSTILRAIKDHRPMTNGWMLYYKAEEDIVADADKPEEVRQPRVPEDENAPAWSRERKPITGIMGKEKRHWESIYQCCRELGATYDKVRSACRHYKKIDGWMLMFDEIPTNQQ
jgi:hypothetical protein